MPKGLDTRMISDWGENPQREWKRSTPMHSANSGASPLVGL